MKIDTPSISGSISLTGARIDDVALVKYRDTVDPKSPAIELFSPSGTKEPFYAEFGFVLPFDPTHRLFDPALGGGIQHVSDCLAAYLKRADRDDALLIGYADHLGNGAVFKRLGFLAETDPRGMALVAPCRERLTKGNAKLDPALPCPRLISRWRLFVPAQWAKRGPR